MLRDVPTYVATAIESTRTRPGVLIELALDSTLRLSTRGDVQDNAGVLWSGTPGVKFSMPDGMTARVSMPNVDPARVQYVCGGAWRGQTLRAWQYWIEPSALAAAGLGAPGLFAETYMHKVPLFAGVLDAASKTRPVLELSAVRTGGAKTNFPPLRWDRSWYPALPLPGSTLTWNGDKYVVPLAK